MNAKELGALAYETLNQQILSTPSGEKRNKLTEINLIVMALAYSPEKLDSMLDRVQIVDSKPMLCPVDDEVKDALGLQLEFQRKVEKLGWELFIIKNSDYTGFCIRVMPTFEFVSIASKTLNMKLEIVAKDREYLYLMPYVDKPDERTVATFKVSKLQEGLEFAERHTE